MAETEKNFAGVLKQWSSLKSTDLPALNRQLKGANLPEIKIEPSEAQQQAASDDVE